MSTDEEKKPPKQPIYLLGNTPLAQYLAVKFALKGENPVLLFSKQFGEDTQVEISLREEHSLKKQKLLISCEHFSSQKAKMLIITSESKNLKSELMLLSSTHFSNAPIVVFSALPDFRIIENLLKHNTIRGYFNGYLSQKDYMEISILGE